MVRGLRDPFEVTHFAQNGSLNMTSEGLLVVKQGALDFKEQVEDMETGENQDLALSESCANSQDARVVKGDESLT